VAAEMGIVGYIRGASAWTQKSPPLQMLTADSKFECDALARRELTAITKKQLKDNRPKAEDLEYTFQKSTTDYEN
jgi:myo-inositol-1-phosphate synthase